MKHIFLSISLLFLTSVAYTQQSVKIMPNTPHSFNSQIEKLSPIFSPGKCHFRLILKGVTVSVHNTSSFQSAGYYPSGTENWSIPLLCHANASQNDIDGQVGAKLINGKWIDENSKLPFDPDQHLEVYNFSGKNWTGKGIAYSQIYGDEARRQRFFNFCLIENNGPQVLCGHTQVRNLNSPPSSSTLPKIMAILKTIEFVDQSVDHAAISGTAAKN
ncbi:hypothetical protein [Dyella acidiphila]|uniref:Uncharacterized protein n=1 Tax=Dyella acidiphila TaxID=2775866 RepID=A0ABR9GCX4_9GAMM|nr:hypothetical protein [Dyella acidiphila]MBE1161898.1 hypothetical protein [Dyella acidiphila]